MRKSKKVQWRKDFLVLISKPLNWWSLPRREHLVPSNTRVSMSTVTIEQSTPFWLTCHFSTWDSSSFLAKRFLASSPEPMESSQVLPHLLSPTSLILNLWQKMSSQLSKTSRKRILDWVTSSASTHFNRTWFIIKSSSNSNVLPTHYWWSI